MASTQHSKAPVHGVWESKSEFDDQDAWHHPGRLDGIRNHRSCTARGWLQRAAETAADDAAAHRAEEDKPQKGGAIVTLGDKKINISPEFATAYKAQVAAFDSKDTAGYPATSAAAHAAAKKPEEHFLASQIDLKAANAAKDEAGMGTALEAMIATGVFPQDQLSTAYTTLGKVKYNQKQFPQAIAAFQKAIELQPTNTEASTLLSQTKSVTATPAEAIAELQKAIAQGSANGGKPPEDVFKRAISVAYRAKMPVVQDLSRQWVAAYPSATNWRDALGIYRQMNNVDDQTTLDLFRLARAAKAMNGEGDYDRYAYAALMKGYPGEAKVVLDEGIAAGAVDPKKSPFKEMIQQATQKSAGEEATLDAAASKALAGGTAKSALTTGDLLYGYGRFDKAAELYRAALKRPGADAESHQPAPWHGLSAVGRQGRGNRGFERSHRAPHRYCEILARLFGHPGLRLRPGALIKVLPAWFSTSGLSQIGMVAQQPLP